MKQNDELATRPVEGTEAQPGRSPKTKVFWRCEFCSPNQSRMAEVDGEDAPASACYQAVLETHREMSPTCIASPLTGYVSVDFLVRLVQ